MKTQALIAYALDKWGYKLSLDQAYKAKCRALQKIQGASKEYKHLRQYNEEVLRRNKNNTMTIKTNACQKGPIFEIIYVS